LKVLLLINSFGAGGAERSTYLIARHLIDLGEQVVLVALKPKEVGITDEVDSLGAPVYTCQQPSRREKLKFIREVIEREQPDIVHSVIFEANVLARLASLRKGGNDYRLVQSLVSTPYVKQRKVTGKVAKFKFFLAKMTDAITARIADVHYHGISQAVLDHYRPYYGLTGKDYTLVYRSRAENTHPPVVAPPGSPLRIINVGRQEAVKGQLLILQALQLLRDELETDNWALKVYGREGSVTHKLKAAIVEYRLADKVTLEGFSSEMESAYREADIFVFASYYEGMGGALVEAMAAGLPCVCTDLPVLREVVGNREGALFFKMGDARDLAKQLEKLITDADLRQQLSQRALHRFRTTFTNESVLDQMISMYQRQLSS
jgi:glycosyltransferase involved in cell wall biosynthesis